MIDNNFTARPPAPPTSRKKFILLPVLVLVIAIGIASMEAKLNNGTGTSDDEMARVSESLSLPPDPGEAGKATLEGVDSDNDGVRDDVQRWIVLNYSGSIRSGLLQYAKAAQSFLLETDTDQSVLAARARSINDSQDCLFYLVGVDSTETATDRVQAQILNTATRQATYLSQDALLSGAAFTLTPTNDRQFKCATDEHLLPPDPGEAGKQTLEGIDSDSDGVRDDVQRWIAVTYPANPDEPNLLPALNQVARAELALVSAPGKDDELLSEIQKQRRGANDCLEFAAGASKGRTVALDLIVQVLNTKERSLAYTRNYESSLPRAYLYTDDSLLSQLCDFEVK